MNWFQKIKGDVREILKEHPVSIGVFFLGCVAAGIYEDIYGRQPVQFAFVLLMLLAPCFVVIEANYFYKKEKGRIGSLLELRQSLPYLLFFFVSFGISFAYAYMYSFRDGQISSESGSLYVPFTYVSRAVYVYLAVSVIGAVFFMYKKSDMTLEEYSVRAFLGVMKAFLLYAVVALGSLCLIYAFNALLFELEVISLIELIIAGAVGFPALLIGLSKISEELGKFSKIVMGYVLPAIVAVACVIVYFYIVKIIVVRVMPSNEAFAIMTGIFVSGLLIWTTAQGCTEDPIHRFLLYFPIVFAPFIVIQIISLSMRIGQYGLTTSRYMGILLICFEIIYVGYYIFCLIKQVGVGGFLFPLMLAPVVVFFAVPGINAYASVSRSQGKVVEQYMESIADGISAGYGRAGAAKSAYKTIKDEGSIEGMALIERLKEKYPSLADEMASSGSSDYYLDSSNSIYVCNSHPMVELGGYSYMKKADVSVYEGTIDPAQVPVYENYDRSEQLGTVDLSEVLDELKALQDSGAVSTDMIPVIDRVLPMEGGAGLYIYDINLELDEAYNLNSISFSGFYLYN